MIKGIKALICGKRAEKAKVSWEKAEETISYDKRSLLVKALEDFVIIWLLAVSTLSCISDVWPEITVNGRGKFVLFLAILTAVFFFDLVLPAYFNKYGNLLTDAKCRYIRLGMLLSETVFTVIFIVAFRTKLKSGFFELLRPYAERYEFYFRKRFEVPAGNKNEVSLFIVSAVIIIDLIILNIYFFTDFKFIFLLLPLLVVSAEMYVGKAPGWFSFFGIAASFVLTVMLSRSYGIKGVRKNRLYSGRKGLRDYYGIIAGTVSLIVIFIIASSLNKPAEWLVRNANPVRQVSTDIEEEFTNLIDNVFGLSSMETMRKITNDSPMYADIEVCTINVSSMIKGNIYQRAYLGSSYEDNAWNYDPSVFKKACKEAGLDADEVRSQIEGFLYAKITNIPYSGTGTADYTIRYQKGSGYASLVPYYVSEYSKAGKYYGDSIRVRKNTGREINFSALNTSNIPADCILQATQMVNDKEEQIWQFYDSYVRENYLSVSEDVPIVEELAQWLLTSDYNNNKLNTNLWRLSMAEATAVAVSELSYGWELDSLPPDTDVINYFITEGHKGYAPHFASAGVLILRSMGIPARYAEGYVLNGEAFKPKEDGSYETQVLDRDSHSWVEIYLNHAGWVPIEMTPSYYIYDELVITGQEEKRLRGKNAHSFNDSKEFEVKPWTVIPEYSGGGFTEDNGEEESGDYSDNPLIGLGPVVGLIPGINEEPYKSLSGIYAAFEPGRMKTSGSTVNDSQGFRLGAVITAIPGYRQGPGMELTPEMGGGYLFTNQSGTSAIDQGSDSSVEVIFSFGIIEINPYKGFENESDYTPGPKIIVGPQWGVQYPEENESDYYNSENYIHIGPSAVFYYGTGEGGKENSDDTGLDSEDQGKNPDPTFGINLGPDSDEIKPDTDMEKENDPDITIEEITPNGNSGQEEYGDNRQEEDPAISESGQKGEKNDKDTPASTESDANTGSSQLKPEIESETDKAYESQGETLTESTGNFRKSITEILEVIGLWIKKALIVVGWILLFMLAGFAVINILGLMAVPFKLIIIRYYKPVEKLHDNKENRRLIRLINRRLYRNLKLAGRFVKRYPTDETFETVLTTRYSDISQDKWKQYMEIVKKARFSSVENDLSDEEAALCYRIYNRLKVFKHNYWYTFYINVMWKKLLSWNNIKKNKNKDDK